MKKVAKVLSLIVVAIFMIMLVGCDNDMAKTNTATDIQDLEFEIKMEDLGFSEDNYCPLGSYIVKNTNKNELFPNDYKTEYFDYIYIEKDKTYILDNIHYQNGIATFNYFEKTTQEYTTKQYQNIDYWGIDTPSKLEKYVENINGTEFETIIVKNPYLPGVQLDHKGILYKLEYCNIIVFDEPYTMENMSSIIFSKNYTIEIDKA